MKKYIPFATLVIAALLLPASAQEAEKETAPPASTESPAAPPKESAPKETPKEAAAEESDIPPDLGENVSADNNVSFPVDI